MALAGGVFGNVKARFIPKRQSNNFHQTEKGKKKKKRVFDWGSRVPEGAKV